jgi:DnaD/phage-associated family protein
MGTAFIKLRQDLPVVEFRNGRSYTPLVLFLWFLTRLQEGDNRVLVDADYRIIQAATGITKTDAIVTALKHLHDQGFVAYVGNHVDGSCCYEVSDRWALRGPGRPVPKGAPKVRPLVTDSSSCLSPDSIPEKKQRQDSPTFGGTKGGGKNPFELYEDEAFGRLTPLVADDLGDLIDTYGEEAVVEAMRIAVRNNKRSLSYVRGILRNQHQTTSKYAVEDDIIDFADTGDFASDDPSPKKPAFDGDPAAYTCWQTARDELQLQIPRQAFDSWLRPARLLAYADGLFTVGVANDIAKAWLDQRLKPVVVRTLSQVARREVDVVFEVMSRNEAHHD